MRSLPRPRLLVAALSTAFGSSMAAFGPATAQTVAQAEAPAPGASAPAVTLPPISVRGTSVDGQSGHVAKRNVTGTKTDTPLLQTPQSISVITRQEIEDKGFTTLTEALAQTPGITVSPFGFDSRGIDFILLRGFDGYYTSSYRDGLAQNVGLAFLSVQTEVYGLERLEVLRGPSSVLFGKGDVGGVVNRVSKIPGADAPREVVVQLGSYDHKQIALDVGGAVDTSGQWLYRLVGVGLDTGTQEQYPNGDRMTQKRQYLAPSLRWQPDAQTSLTLLAEHLRDNGSDDVQFVTGADGRPTNVKEGDPTYSRLKTGADAIGYQFEHQLASGWTVQQNFRYAHRTSDKHHILSSLDADGVTLERLARHDVESVNEAALDTHLEGTLQAGALAHRLLLGVDWDHSAAEWRRTQDMTTPLNMNDPVYGIHIAEPTTLAANTLVTSTQLGFYAQDQIRVGPHWGLTLGARHDRAKSDTDDRYTPTNDASQSDGATTGRIGIDYQVGNGWAPYVSYGQSFVPNVGVDGAGTAFVPSLGRQVELGIKYIPEGAPMTFTAAVFNLEKTHVVGYDPVTYDPRQIGKIRSQGLELEAKATLSRQLNMTASFTALNMKVLASVDPTEVGNMPILTPKQTGSVWLDYALDQQLRGLSVAGGLRYTGKRFNDAQNSSFEPTYTLADAAVRYETGPWRFAVNVSNLFDKHYYSGVAYGSYFRGADRNVTLTARYRF